MSERSRLPDSLRWQSVGWMGMGFSQADAARRLDASRNVVHRLWKQYQTEAYVTRGHVPDRPRYTTPAEDRFIDLSARSRRSISVPQLVADHSVSPGEEYQLVRCESVFTMQVLCKATSCAYPSHRTTEKGPLILGNRTLSWTRQRWASVLFTDESKFTLESDSGPLLIWREQNTRYHQSNIVERDSYRAGGIMVWAGILVGGHIDLHVFQGETVTGERYRVEILDSYVRPYVGAIGNGFILMDDNARAHRAAVVEEYFEGLGLERMEWPARSPDLNQIEHLRYYLRRQVAASSLPPRSL